MIEVSFKCVIGSQVETTNWPQTSSKFFKTLEPTRLWRHRPITMTCSVLTKIMTYVQLRHFLEGGYVQKMGVAMPSSNAIARSDGWRGKKDKTKSDGKQGTGDNWQLQRGGGGKICQPISESNENASRPNVLSIYCGQNYHKMAKAVFRCCLFHTRLHQQQP